MPRPTIWVFEDQLSLRLPSLAEAPPDAPLFMVESDRAWRVVPFHKLRLAFLASAMRHFAADVAAAGRPVAYYPLRPTGYLDSLSAIRDHVSRTGSREFWVVEPSEHHTRAWLDTLPARLDIAIRYFPNTLFLTDRQEFAGWACGLRSPVMEHFYRRMRRRHGVLMDGDEPAGGRWNFDTENRRPLPEGLLIPPPPSFTPDAVTREVMAEVARRFPDHPGDVASFALPVTRRDAEAAFCDFLDRRLPLFGDFEDAMRTGQPTLFHSRISALLNAGLLDPLQCVRAAEERYRAGRAPINAVEGFVRQILGWREYVYGIYWAFMPAYRDRNARGDRRPLPPFFWSGQTELNCVRQCVGEVLRDAYNHHIQRLMIICNFSTLAGLSPQAVNDWFYAMYADSHDWVVTPNVVGMGMNADGGTMATKPYVSSAAYVDRMSDYCRGCRYDRKARTGEAACPFNYLYWSFLDRNRATLGRNPRMQMILKNLDRIGPAELRQMRSAADAFLASLAGGAAAVTGPGGTRRRAARI